MGRDVSNPLQGLDGWDEVPNGGLFSGRSRGFQVATAGTFDFSNMNPKGQSVSVSLSLSTPGVFIGGMITALSPTGGGSALVYPADSDYDIA